MSDIQRWDMFAEVGINEPVKYDMWEAVEGRYVLYADHVAAVAAAEQRGYVRGVAQVENERYVDGMQAARDAVAGLNAEHRPSDSSSACECFSCLLFGEALAAIDAIDGVGKP